MTWLLTASVTFMAVGLTAAVLAALYLRSHPATPPRPVNR